MAAFTDADGKKTVPDLTGQEDDDDEDDDDDDDDDDDEDEDDQVEPKLKYDRICNDLTGIFNKDAASCISVHPKFLALGTHWGVIHILDHSGNDIKNMELNAHSTTINQISIDDNGDYIASCSDDGKVIISGLYASENNQSVTFDRPVKAVALDPYFFKPSGGRQFVTGDEKLILNERGGLFSRHKMTVLHQGEGPIRNIKWKGEFIAWANDRSVKIYDMTARKRITHIDKGHNYRPELYGCSLFWRDNHTLLLGWADCVKVCVVKDQEKKDSRDVLNRYVEIVAMFKTDFFICGIAPLADSVVVLAYDKDDPHQEGGHMTSSRPHLLVLDAGMNKYEEISNDALSIRGFQEYRCNDYHLECIVEENLFYIVSPKDVVVAKLRDADDHITWLLEHEQFETAMSAATQNEGKLKIHSFEGIGRRYLNYLLEEQCYDEAAQLCVKILGKNKDLWEEEVYKFAKISQLKAIAPFLPRSEPKLCPAIYEMVLNEFLQTDPERFYQVIKEWPQNLYCIETIITAVLTKMDKDRNNPDLLQCLGQLYACQRSFDKALSIYLRLKHKDVFQLIHKHNLFDAISDKIVQLMQFDQKQACSMLLDNVAKVPVSKVVKQLEKSPKYLYVYLDQVVQREPNSAQEYHGELVKLYAEFDRPKLLPFLRRSESYPLQMALDECEIRSFDREQVFLLGRMGNVRQALTLIMTKLKDVEHAIEFCKDQVDEELWEDLITFSLDKPNFIRALLQNIGADIDPIKVISRIEKGMEIPSLRDSLVKILQDYNLQISLREGCRRILVADSFNLLERLVRTQRKGVFVDDAQVCRICGQQLIVNDLRYSSNIKAFFCNHAFHEDCLPEGAINCKICSSTKRGPGSHTKYTR